MRKSLNGTLPIFKAIKANIHAFQTFVEALDDNKALYINVLDNKGMTPLAKLASKPQSEENFKKISLLIKNKATCAKSLPKYHPMFMALKSKNIRVVKALFKHTDAIHCLNDYKPSDPFMIGLAKCNND